MHAPLAFVAAAMLMGLTAASFAELGTRMPVAAGEAAYVRAAFGSDRWSATVGFLVIATAVVAAAAISIGSAGYVAVFVALPQPVIIAAVVLSVGTIAAWGIKESVAFAGAMTLIEVGGLFVLVAAGAFSGPNPRAIFLTLVLTTLLYVLVVWVALVAVPTAELAASEAPLALAFERLTGASPRVMSAIAIVATLNGIVVQIILAARVLYGLARQGTLPPLFQDVSPVTQTPLVATAVAVALVLTLACLLPSRASPISRPASRCFCSQSSTLR
jgi:basic amino acid/polyamine antiporter, APA family